MTTAILSDVAFHDPDNLIPYAELDDAIVRSLTRGLLDFSNPDCYSGSGAIAAGTVMQSLTTDRGAATAATALGAVTNGLLGLPNTVSGPKLNLPDTFKLPATCKKFLAILWLKAPKTGWAASGSLYSLMGVLNNVTTTAQWGVSLTNNTGTIAQANVYVPVSDTSAGTAFTVNGSALDSLLDGTLHQLALEWEVDAVADTYTARLYRDGAQVGIGTGSFTAATITVPATAPCIGRAGSSFLTAFAPGVYVGRPSLWDLSGSGRSVANILADDADAAAGYLL